MAGYSLLAEQVPDPGDSRREHLANPRVGAELNDIVVRSFAAVHQDHPGPRLERDVDHGPELWWEVVPQGRQALRGAGLTREEGPPRRRRLALHCGATGRWPAP